MSLRTTNEILDATEHLPNGAALVVHEFSWDDYERLLEDLADRPHLRITYDCGRLEIMSPSSEHETIVRLLEDLVLVFCEASHLPIEKFGQTTWKRRGLRKGAEPDACYYIHDTQRVSGKRLFNLESDPPPDVVVEIDITSESLQKFSIYAALSVPELWWYDGQSFRFYGLVDGAYVETGSSYFLPGLTGTMLSEAIEIGRNRNQTEARQAFRRQIPRRHGP